MPACLSAHLRSGCSAHWRTEELNSLLALREPQAEPLGGRIDEIQQTADHPTSSVGDQRRSCRRDDLLQGMEGQVRRRNLGSSRKDLGQAGVTTMAHLMKLQTEVAEELPVGSWHYWAARLNAVLIPLVEIPAALLVLAEIVVLLAGILARYVFHTPIVWSDELAGILFLWLAMLGSVLALQRGEHMRMTAIVGMLKPRARAFLDVVAVAAALAFLFLVLHPAYEFAADEIYITTPALEISNAWRAAALPVGIGLMLLVALLRLASVADWRH